MSEPSFNEKAPKDGVYVDGSYDHERESVAAEGHTLKRQLKNRHVAMISIGGVIGTGLFLGTATALANGGPIGLLLGYMVVGSITYAVMNSLGEMCSFLPIAGGHIKLAERFVDPSFSFAMGWNYWYNWVIVLPAELSAAAVLIDYWDKNTKLNAAWVAICLVVVVCINFLGSGAYGEAEFIFASIKVVTITGLIILGIVIDLGGAPNHDRLGFRYWKNPGPFVQFDGIPGNTGRFLGWWAVMTQAAFSYIGTEIVAIAAGEAKNPRRNIPRAIKRVYIRIMLFYFGGVIIIGLLVPSNYPNLAADTSTAAGSPFVIAMNRGGIKVLPHIVNACLLTSAWSAASSDMYTSSRALYGLAIAGNAPRFFSKTTKNGLPWPALVVSTAFALLSFMGVSTGAGKVFGWFSNMTSIAGLMTWFGIGVTYLRFYAGTKAQGIDRSTLPFRSPLQPYLAWYTVISTLVICFFSGYSVFLKGHWLASTFVTNYLPFVLFPILYVGSRLWKRKGPIAAADMDFVSNIAEIEADETDDPPPRNKVEAAWQWLM